MTIKWLLHIMMLSVCSVEDKKKKEVALWKIIVYGIVIIGYGIWELYVNQESAGLWIIRWAVGGIPGIVLLILAKTTKEAVGYADGILTVIIGVSMGFWQTLGILSTAFTGIFFIAAYFFIRSKKKRRIAFIPFLLLGMAGGRLWMDF